MCLQPLPLPHCSLPSPKHHPSTRLGSIPQATNLWWVSLGSQIYTATRRQRAVPLKRRPGSRISSKDIHGRSNEPDRAMRRERGTHRGKSVTLDLTTTTVTFLRGHRWPRPRTPTPVHLSTCPLCVPLTDLISKSQVSCALGSRNAFTSIVYSASTN